MFLECLKNLMKTTFVGEFMARPRARKFVSGKKFPHFEIILVPAFTHYEILNSP